MKNCFFAFFLCTFSLALHCEETLTVVRGEGDYFPVEYVENGKLTGLHIDLIRAVADELNITVEFESLPWNRGVFDFKQGKYDAMSHLSRTEERENFAHFIKGNIISSAKTYPIILSSRRDEIAFDGTLTSLTAYIIAVGAGYRYGVPFDSASFLSKYEIPTPTQEVLTKLLRLERVDVIIGSRRNLLQVHSEYEVNETYHVFEQPVASDDSYLAFSKVRNKLGIARKFAAALSQYKSTQAYMDLLQYYKNKER
jgi:polar amino acid transport system substrate-binding protein